MNTDIATILIGLIITCLSKGLQVEKYHRVCYFPIWKQYGIGLSKFSIANVSDPSLCTHIVVAFAGVNPETFTIKPLEYATGGLTGVWRNITNIKQKYPEMKVLLAIGGYNYGPLPFSKMVRTNLGIDAFALNSVPYLRTNYFDGLDIDWEYPGQDGSPATDKYRFTLLLKALHDCFLEESLRTGLPRLTLTIAAPVEQSIVDQGYEVAKISSYVDFINLMTYDMYGPWGGVIGHHSALYGKSTDTPYMANRNANWVVNYWLSKGMPANKIVMGVPFYGRTFSPINATVNQPGFAFKGAGSRGPFTGSNGMIAAFELCKLLNNPSYNLEWDYQTMAPFAYSTTDWIGYDDQQSIKIKANYVKDRQLGGIMIWDVSLDDFAGTFCNLGQFPLLREIQNILSVNNHPVMTYQDYLRLWLHRLIG